jgi:hypothetical protein
MRFFGGQHFFICRYPTLRLFLYLYDDTASQEQLEPQPDISDDIGTGIMRHGIVIQMIIQVTNPPEN